MYFYQLLSPERCTVMIEKLCDRDSWRITELRAHADRIPGFGTLQKVCDVLGIAAQPVWLREKSWWSDEQDCVCSPRKDSGGHDTGRTHSIDPDVDQMIADWTEFDKWPQQKFDFALSEALKALVIEHP